MKHCTWYMVLCTLVLGLGLGVTSCKDDEENKESASCPVDSVEGLAGTVEEEQLRDLVCLWTDMQRDELTGSWLSASYEPTVGHVVDESAPYVRSLQVDNIEAADDYAVGAFATLGINCMNPDGFTFSNAEVGTVNYRHSADANTLAVIDVNVRQLPHLTQLRLVKSLPDNAGEEPYYATGDIVKYKNRYYVCVSDHKYKEQARFINFTRDENRPTGTFGWLGVGKDTVYNDQMASFETIACWIENILLDDIRYDGVVGALFDRGLRDRYDIVEQMVPRSDTLRALLAANLFKMDSKVYSVTTVGSRISAFEYYYTENYRRYLNRAEGDPDVIVAAPSSFLLADKVRWSMKGTTWDQWAPYVHCVWNKEFGTYYGQMLDDESQSTLSPSHFTWQCKQVKSNKMFNIETEGFKQKDKYWICYNAIHWRHETQLVGAYLPGEADDRTPTNYLLNFTKDWTQHPKAFCRNAARKVPYNWTTRNVTSRELTFTDDGTRNSKCETVFAIGHR